MKSVSIICGFMCCIFFALTSFGQTVKEAVDFFAVNQFDSALVITKKIIENDKSNVDAYVLAGRILVAKRNYVEAMVYLEKAQTFPDAPAYDKAWTMFELGLCYYYKSDYKKARLNLEGCIQLNATKNSTSAARHFINEFGFDKFYDAWITRETAHFIFHFQDTSSINDVSRFIQRKEAAFDSINNFFNAVLPKKIDYFVWSDAESAKPFFRRPLAFTDEQFCVTHTETHHTIGHEMTHTISFYSNPGHRGNRLIDEGVCVYFDLSKKNNLVILQSRKDRPVSIIDIWNNPPAFDEELVYALGGELVKRLISTHGKEKFMHLFADQTYDNAKIIYGAELDATIKKLEEEINR